MQFYKNTLNSEKRYEYMTNKIIRYLPAILIEIFIGMTYMFYRCGVWMYPYRKDNLTLFFMIACLTLFAIGYWWQEGHRKKSASKTFPIEKVAKVVMGINLLLMIPYCLCRTGCFFPQIYTALQDLSAAYARATEAAGQYGGLHMVVGFGTIFIYLGYHIAYFYWEDLNIKIKLMGLVECIWFLLVDVCTGRNKGITVICIMIVIMYIIKMCDKEYCKNKNAIMLRTIVTILIVAMVPLYFAKSIADRGNNSVAELESTGMSIKETVMGSAESVDMIVDQYGYQEVEVENSDSESSADKFNEYEVKVVPGKVSKQIVDRYNTNAVIVAQVHPYYADEFSYSYVNLDDPIYKILPDTLKYVYVMGTSYVSHGYHGLTIALRLPFESCYGFGHLTILHNKIKSLTGIDIYKRTYVYKLNQAGYPVSLKWGTAFLQWASDISFIGVVFLMGILGILVVTLWNEVLEEKNLISLMLLSSLTVNLLFITSWWQAGVTGTDFILFYGSLTIWIMQKVIKILKEHSDRKAK